MNSQSFVTQVRFGDTDKPTPFSTSLQYPSLGNYFRQERERLPRYLGQLSPEFQAALAAHHQTVTPADCDFYHSIETSDGTVHPGAWDLRGHEAAYIGHQAVGGKRVLEFGPASGWLSAYMAAQGADLTIFDLPLGGSPELIPMHDIDISEQMRNSAVSAGRLRNSWWYAKRRLNIEAKAVYADIYDPPDDIGRADISFFGAILLHLCSPFQALKGAAAITDEAIVVTDVYSAPSLTALDAVMGMVPSLTVFNPSPPPVGLTHWWALSPELIQHMLRLLGFTEQTVTQHSPPRMSPQPPMFTVVGRRPSPVRSGIRAVAVAPFDPPVPHAAPDLPVPPPELRFLVAGTGDEATFLDLGQLGFDALTSSLRRHGVDPESLGKVLDFGCGVGRLIRHWKQFPSLGIHGTDLSHEMIEWDRANLPFATFGANTVEPDLSYTSQSFGLIYALSVFTHLPVEFQVSWWKELVRVTRPDGLLYFTTHGVKYRHLLTRQQQDDFDAGRIVVTGGDQPGSNHCAAFHSRDCIEKEFIAAFGMDLLEHVPCGAMGNPEQDSYLVRKRSW